MGWKGSLKKIGRQFDKNITRPAMRVYGTILTGTTNTAEQKERLKMVASTAAAYYTGGVSKQLEGQYYAAKQARQQAEYDAAEQAAYDANSLTYKQTNVPARPPEYSMPPKVQQVATTAPRSVPRPASSKKEKFPILYIGIGLFLVFIVLIMRK